MKMKCISCVQLPKLCFKPFHNAMYMIKIHKLNLYMNLLSIYYTTIWTTNNVWKVD
jgi:hypothetical protein